MSTLPRILLEGPVRQALLEDLGRAGDLTSDAIVGADQAGRVALVARDHGVVAGLDAALLASPERRAAAGAAAQARVRREFSAEAWAGRLLDLYDEVRQEEAHAGAR